ncbi:hypothetical protein AUK40_01600 [Candidatus Wirthbacteria bacterium CG2_30_54_11]|uniref:Acetyl-CoA acetyltransferase n=1 Tax=Candidatus Wirthbacteria bacterium CG2_30_54_11 TaxID=1817892 RepID=A0A1J5J1L4_9BACT|nr:MAG: hypothetical protein AUK40_01600 [Candidatus Wirthbacteria bacterium CG2_30_54_11]
MYITGLSVSKFGQTSLTLPEMMFSAIEGALKDAALEIKDIEAIYVSNNLSASSNNQCHLGAVLAGYFPGLHLPIFSLEAACGGGGVAVHQACISLKHYQRVLVVGGEKMSVSPDMLYFVAGDADREFDQREGLVFPAAGALAASTYMQKYGATMHDFALVSYKNHQNGNLNPNAHFFGKDVTMEMIENSKVICSPLRLFDCSANTDGAAAMVMERGKRTHRSIQIIGSAFATNHINFAQDRDPTDRKEVQKAASDAFRQANLTPKDIQVAEIHDGFTPVELIMLENLSFCGRGEAVKWIREGRTSRTGSLPVNPSGGLKACGHPVGATGIRQVAEIATQLRGEAGARQVANAQTGLAYNFGSLVGSAIVHILRK